MFKRQVPAQPLPRPLRVIKYVRYGLIFSFALMFAFQIGLLPNLDKDRRLSGLAIDSQDNVYVGDTAHSVVRKLDKQGNQVAIWGGEGIGDGQFARYSAPYPLAVGPGNTIFVLDSYNNRIQKFDANGKFLGKFGSPGNAPGQFNRPSNMVVDSQGTIFVWQDTTLQKYDASGNFLGNFGEGQPDFDKVWGARILAVDTVGNIYIEASNASNKFLVFDPQGALLRTLTFPQNGFRYLAVDRQGTLYFTDDGGKELFKVDPAGNVLERWPLGGDKYGTGEYNGTAFDSQGNTYVLKYYASSVISFNANGQQIKEVSVGLPEWLMGNLYLFQMFLSFIPISLIIFERIYRKRHHLEEPQKKEETFVRRPIGKASQLICLVASMLGILVGFPTVAVITAINPGSMTSTAYSTGLNLQSSIFLYGTLVLYFLVLYMVFLVKKKPVVAGTLQIGAGTIIFFMTDVLALKVLPIAIIIGGALALYDSNKRESLPEKWN